MDLGGARDLHPAEGMNVARGEAQRLVDMGFSFLGAANDDLTNGDNGVRVGQISILRQGALAVSDALSRAIGVNLDSTHRGVSRSMAWSKGERAGQNRFGRGQTLRSVVHHERDGVNQVRIR